MAWHQSWFYDKPPPPIKVASTNLTLTLNMPTTKPKAVPFEWLEQNILPKLGDALRQDLEATLDELKQLPTSVSYYGF